MRSQDVLQHYRYSIFFAANTELLHSGTIFFTQTIVWKMRALLINLYTAEVINWLAGSVLFAGYPVRAYQRQEDYCCSIVFSLGMIFAAQKFSAVALYAVSVCVCLVASIRLSGIS